MNKRLFSLAAGILLAVLVVVGIGFMMIRGSKDDKQELTSVSPEDIQVSIITTTGENTEPGEAQTDAPVIELPEETTTAPQEDVITYFFRSDKQYESHYEKHGAEFGDITKEEYLKKANALIKNTSDTILHKIEKEDGDYVFYDSENNEILFLSGDGYIRTYFKPSGGMDYYNRQ
ncbi:MAG: hypothetical protein IJ740_14560 [Ruminococcus sp.]|nr:hypothetical protein [Ruminococcus sp.]